MYGRSGLGQVSANTAGALTITADSWATGTWAAGLANCILEAWTGTGSSATQHNGDLVITNVNVLDKDYYGKRN